MIGIKMVREGYGVRMWSVNSDKFDDALDDVMKKLTERNGTYAETDPVIELQFTLNKSYRRFVAG